MKIHVWIAGFVPLATALLLGASQAKVETSGTRQTQPATVEVKIDNFSFGPATVTVLPVPRSPGPIATTFPTPSSAMTKSSNPKSSIPTRNSPTRSTSPAPIHTSARCTPR